MCIRFLGSHPDENVLDHGAIETKTVEQVQQEPYHLPAGYEWCECDMTDEKVVRRIVLVRAFFQH